MNFSPTTGRWRSNRAIRRAATLLTPILLLASGFLLSSAVTASPAGATTVEQCFTRMLNHARSAHQRPRLSTQAALTRVARQQAHRMADRRVLYHNPNLTSEIRNWRWVGENVGYGPSCTTVHAAFMASAPHRANILDRDYTQVGVGAIVRDGRVWVAEVFRRPLH
jgi:uncharacterized protein YkwD